MIISIFAQVNQEREKNVVMITYSTYIVFSNNENHPKHLELEFSLIKSLKCCKMRLRGWFSNTMSSIELQLSLLRCIKACEFRIDNNPLHITASGLKTV